jgi:CNT family concentrative nucleoside transporter
MLIGKVMVPETEESSTRGEVKLEIPKIDANVIDAAARGAGEGLQLALNVGAMLLAFIALVALLDFLIGLPGEWINAAVGSAVVPELSMAKILGWAFWPIAFVMGVPVDDCGAVAGLLGEKMILNEFVAYLHLAESLGSGEALSHRAVVIVTYALCGFANLGSIAIQIGGIGGMAPSRRSDLARLGLRAMIGGTLAACMTGAVAGILV